MKFEPNICSNRGLAPRLPGFHRAQSEGHWHSWEQQMKLSRVWLLSTTSGSFPSLITVKLSPVIQAICAGGPHRMVEHTSLPFLMMLSWPGSTLSLPLSCLMLLVLQIQVSRKNKLSFWCSTGLTEVFSPEPDRDCALRGDYLPISPSVLCLGEPSLSPLG